MQQKPKLLFTLIGQRGPREAARVEEPMDVTRDRARQWIQRLVLRRGSRLQAPRQLNVLGFGAG